MDIVESNYFIIFPVPGLSDLQPCNVTNFLNVIQELNNEDEYSTASFQRASVLHMLKRSAKSYF